MMARDTLRALSRSYIMRVLEAQKQQAFLVEISAHHIHLTQEHVEALFGKGHQLERHTDLSQPGQYACHEQLAIVEVQPEGRRPMAARDFAAGHRVAVGLTSFSLLPNYALARQR